MDYFNVTYIVPGWVEGCSTIDSLFLSSLECFFSDSDCLPVVIDHIQNRYFRLEDASWFDVRPLVYDRNLSRFPPKTSILMIVKHMMIEQWNSNFSYNLYYESCAPSYCTYSDTIRTKGAGEILVSLMSISGGLSSSLYLITPQLVKFVFYLFRLIFKRQREQQEQSNH
jgi:hypothetical protein